MMDKEVHICAVEEARTLAGAKAADGFYIISSGAEKGQGGVELWFNLVTPYAVKGDNKRFIKKKHILAQEGRTHIQIKYKKIPKKKN